MIGMYISGVSFVVLLHVYGVVCVPPPTPDQIEDYKTFRIGYVDPSFGAHIKYVQPDYAARHAEHNFRYTFVDQTGNRYPSRGGRNDLLEVSATETVDTLTLNTALKTVYLECRYMPRIVWMQLCKNGAVGVFTMAEGTTIFPEYAMYRDTPACRGTCAGNCAITCTGDGRKYNSLAGLGGSRGTCVNDNIMCNSNDPYRGQTNILVHEFAHTIHGYALDPTRKSQITSAWRAARAEQIWRLNSYAMSTDFEYFAEATGVFFHANNYLSANGGMSDCFGKGFCTDQNDARKWLQFKDPRLYALLSYTFTDNRPYLPGQLARCTKI